MSTAPAAQDNYRVVPTPLFSTLHLALARRRDLVSAVDAMGDGIVVSADGSRLVAFHERHLDLVERLG